MLFLFIVLGVCLFHQVAFSKLLNTGCDIGRLTSDTVPVSVHQLRPGDIQFIGALGDSLTVGKAIIIK
jgi:hypothetical protein